MTCHANPISGAVSLEAVLHKAACKSQDVIDAMPHDVDIEDESVVIALAIKPVDILAQFILELPGDDEINSRARRRAQDWMDGHYWPKAEAS